MATSTPNHGLYKYGGDDSPDLTKLGPTMDKIDLELKKNADSIGSLDDAKASIAGAVMTGLTATGMFNGMRIRHSNGDGAALFQYPSCVILLLAIDEGTPGNFLLAMGWKGNPGSTHILKTIASSGLGLGDNNGQGTQVVVGGSPEYVITFGISIQRV